MNWLNVNDVSDNKTILKIRNILRDAARKAGFQVLEFVYSLTENNFGVVEWIVYILTDHVY